MTHSTQTGTIYGLKAVGERIVYVGQTTQRPLTRFARHVYHASHSTAVSPVASWLRTADPDGILVVVLERAAVDQLIAREDHWIRELKTLTADGGLNTRRGFAWESGRPSTTADGMNQDNPANHRRWHVARGIVNPSCARCTAVG